MISSSHPKLSKALSQYGESAFAAEAERKLALRPKCKIVLGLLGGPSTGRYGFAHSAGKKYPRYAIRYVRGKGIVGIARHAGPYLYIAL